MSGTPTFAPVHDMVAVAAKVKKDLGAMLERKKYDADAIAHFMELVDQALTDSAFTSRNYPKDNAVTAIWSGFNSLIERAEKMAQQAVANKATLGADTTNVSGLARADLKRFTLQDLLGSHVNTVGPGTRRAEKTVEQLLKKEKPAAPTTGCTDHLLVGAGAIAAAGLALHGGYGLYKDSQPQAVALDQADQAQQRSGGQVFLHGIEVLLGLGIAYLSYAHHQGLGKAAVAAR